MDFPAEANSFEESCQSVLYETAAKAAQEPRQHNINFCIICLFYSNTDPFFSPQDFSFAEEKGKWGFWEAVFLRCLWLQFGFAAQPTPFMLMFYRRAAQGQFHSGLGHYEMVDTMCGTCEAALPHQPSENGPGVPWCLKTCLFSSYTK